MPLSGPLGNDLPNTSLSIGQALLVPGRLLQSLVDTWGEIVLAVPMFRKECSVGVPTQADPRGPFN